MDLKTYIARGATEAGTQKELANRIGVTEQNLAGAKSGRRSLPNYACVKLAQLIGEDERRVIAASELVTEKNPERRAVWLPFVQEIATTAKKKTTRAAKAFAREHSFT